jgi:hypothetical protein
MPDTFDAYYTWLAIPPAEQPPDFYRLVGVTRFEGNFDVISYAVDQRMAHVRNFQVGKHAEHSHKILKELSSARIVLLSPEKKAEYDRQLKAASQSSTTLPKAKPLARAVPLHDSAPLARPVAVETFPIASGSGEKAAPAPAPAKAQNVPSLKPTGLAPLGILLAGTTAAAVILIGVVVYFAMGRSEKPPVAVIAPQPQPQTVPVVPAVQPVPIKPVVKPRVPNPAIPKPVLPQPPLEDTAVEVNAAPPPVTPSSVTPPAETASTRPEEAKTPILRLVRSAHVELASSADLARLDKEFTAEAWVRYPLQPGVRILFGNLPHGDNKASKDGESGWCLQSMNENAFFIMHGDAENGMRSTDSVNQPRDDKWHHLAVCGDGRTLTLYLDGKLLLASKVNPTAGKPRTTSFYLGSPDAKGEDGLYDVAAFRLSSKQQYKASFTPEEVLREGADVVALFDFTKEVAPKVTDISGNQHDGQLQGVIWQYSNDKTPSAFAQLRNPAPFNPEERPDAPPAVAVRRPTGEMIDLLKRIDPSKDVLSGNIRMDNGSVTTGGGNLDFLQINVPLPREYCLEAKVTRKSSLDALGIGFIMANRKCVFCVDAYPSRGNFTGLAVLNDRFLYDPAYPNAHTGTLLTNDRPATLRLAVSGNSLKVWCDGREIYRWQGDPLTIGVTKRMYVPTEAGVFLSSTNSSYEISDFKLLPYDSAAPDSNAKFASGEPGASSRPSATRLPQPDDAAAKKAREEVRGILKDDFATARRPEDKITLAKKLAGLARTSKDNEQFALWEEARHQALDGGNLLLALDLLEEEAKLFEIDTWQAKVDALKQFIPHAKTPADRKSLAELGLKIAEGVAANGQFDLAAQAINMAASSAAKAGDQRLKAEIAKRDRQIDDLKKQANLGKQAAERLKAEPDNAKANHAYGKYLCAILGDWDTGLKHFKKAGQQALADVADADLAKPTDAAGQVALADKWWTLAQAAPVDDKTLMLTRAGYWYEQAEEKMTGLTKVRVTKRIAEIQDELPASLLKPATGASTSVAAKGRVIDLLKLIDVQRDTIKGTWRMQDGVLLCESMHLVPKIYMPYIPPEEYDVKMTWSQPTVRHDLNIIMPKAGASAVWMVGGEGGRMAFNVDVPFGEKNPALKTMPGAFVANRKYTTVVQVRNDGLKAFIDGAEVLSYKTDFKDLKPDSYRSLPDPSRLAIGTDDPTVFHSLEVLEVTGTGKFLQPQR